MTAAEAAVVQSDLTVDELRNVIKHGEQEIKDLMTIQGARQKALTQLESMQVLGYY